MNIHEEFPIIKKYHYLDSTATSLTPRKVIEAIKEYYLEYNSNVHRGVYKLSERATNEYEKSREDVAKFINSKSEEVIFTRNTTESINLIAYTLQNWIKENEVILVSEMEHHSNIVPWQIIAQKTGARVEFITVEDNKKIDLEKYEEQVKEIKPKIVSVTHVSNVLGTINPIDKMMKIAKDEGAYTVIDTAQSAPHLKIDFKKFNADFIAFSAHKMLGPTGVGVLAGNAEILERLPPFLGGGSMIENVSKDGFTTSQTPQKYEAGTPNIADVIGFRKAIEMINQIGLEEIEAHEKDLMRYLHKKIEEIPNLEIISQKDIDHSVGILTFNIKGWNPFDIAAIADEHEVFVRGGHHCAQIIHRKFGYEGSVRASMYFYNNKEDIDALVEVLNEITS